MRLVIQRVKASRVEIGSQIVGRIEKGLLIFLGVEKDDSPQDIDDLVHKVLNLRIFEDPSGKMNLSALEVKAEVLVVPQFTLLGDCRKGRRPSFDRAADPALGEEMYNHFVEKLQGYPLKVATGQFRAKMDVFLVNDGPVTFVL